MTKEKKVKEEQRKDLYLVNPMNIEIREGFNVRSDFGDIELLKASIIENGVKVPLRGHRKKGEEFSYILTDGHRRLQACKELVAEGKIDSNNFRIPFLMEAKAYSDENRIIDMMIYNDGKRLNAMEEAEAINRLVNYGWEKEQIAQKLGKPLQVIYNLLNLYQAPQKTKKLITDYKIAPHLVTNILRETKDYDKVNDIIVAAVEMKVAETSPKVNEEKSEDTPEKPEIKITKKDVQKVTRKFNSFTELKKSFKTNKNIPVNIAYKQTYDMLQSIINGELKKEDFDKIFFA